MRTDEEVQDQAISILEQAMRHALTVGVDRHEIETLTRNVTAQESQHE